MSLSKATKILLSLQLIITLLGIDNQTFVTAHNDETALAVFTFVPMLLLLSFINGGLLLYTRKSKSLRIDKTTRLLTLALVVLSLLLAICIYWRGTHPFWLQ